MVGSNTQASEHLLRRVKDPALRSPGEETLEEGYAKNTYADLLHEQPRTNPIGCQGSSSTLAIHQMMDRKNLEPLISTTT